MHSGRDRDLYCPSDSDFGDEDPNPLSLMDTTSSHYPQQHSDSLGIRGTNYMVLRTSSPVVNNALSGSNSDGNGNTSVDGDKPSTSLSFPNLLNSLGGTDTLMQKGSAYLLQFLSCSQRMFWFFAVILAIFYFYPLTCIVIVGSLFLIMVGGQPNGDTQVSSRTAKWTVTGYSYQMKDGFLVSPPFLDKTGQWRMVIKQKRGMDGLQTCFGLMCTDILPEVEVVTASVSFYCTNQLGQEVATTGGMRNLKFQQDYQCPGDCGYTRQIRLKKKLLGQSETITVHCTVEFRKQMVTFLKTLARNLSSIGTGGVHENDVDIGAIRQSTKKGKNIVHEEGVILPGNLEFHEEDQLPPQFRPVMRFVHHSETRTFVWEIPQFCQLLENSEVWGIYSPQFFVHSHDFCAIWRMKLLEIQGVFRLHVQLRGLPRDIKQVKLWYLLQLVDMYGDSVIPEHAVCRVKYPDHMNLWDTTRHILYRRETILERFVGGENNGALTLRISLQMQPNDVSLMEVDSDEWIQNPGEGTGNSGTEEVVTQQTRGMLRNETDSSNKHKMIAN